MNNRYCENCFYWVNRKEDNPNKSNCDKCNVNPYNKYDGVVIKCENNEELKIAEEFFIKRGIPIGISKSSNMCPCYIGIDEHQVKTRFSFTTFKVFYNKNIILGEINYTGKVITWNRYKYELIDKYLESKSALNISEEKNPPTKEDLKDVTINTNSTVVGYIVGYIAGHNNISCYNSLNNESPIKEDLNPYEGYFIRLWDLDITYEKIIRFFNEVAKIPYPNSGGIGLGYMSTYIGIHKGEIKLISGGSLNMLRDNGELKFVCDRIKINEKEGTTCFNFYKGDEFIGNDMQWNYINHENKHDFSITINKSNFSITINKSKENQNPPKEDLKDVCDCKCNKSESPKKEDSKNIYEMYMTDISGSRNETNISGFRNKSDISGSRNEYIHVDFYSMNVNDKLNYLYKLITNK